MTVRPVSGPSVRGRLLRPLLWIWGIGLLTAVIGAYSLARTSANLAFDRGLQDEVSALAAKITWSNRGPLLDLSLQTMELLGWDREERNAFLMVDVDGNALAGDDTVPVPALLLRRHSFEQPRVFDGMFGGEPVRGAVFSVTSPMLDRSVSFIVVETKRRRQALMRDLQLSILLPALALGLVTFALIGWGIRRGLQPLREVAAEVARRDVQDWRPLPLIHVPREAVPLIERINLLLADMEQATLLQRRFVADAAHQLRTPVAGIRVLAQTLIQELQTGGGGMNTNGHPNPGSNPNPEANWQPLLAQLGRSTDHLSRLIGQLLSLARSEAALAADAELPCLDVVPLLREAAEPLVLQGLREGKSIALEAPDLPVMACAHPLWLGEVIINLLDNACRYGGQEITVRVTAVAGGGARIDVDDDGPGVPVEQLGRLFEPFWRGDRADLRNDGGTGLGLTIAKEVVLRLGGQIEAVSRPAFDGLRFTVLLSG